jgi:transposase-like protein
MSKEIAYPKTLMEAVKYFADPDTTLKFFVSIRWPGGVECPHCGNRKVSFLANQRRWQCHTKHAKRQFSAKVGTIFEDSPLTLEQWMVGVWLEVNAKNSISSYEVHRALGITQKSAWFMLHRIRTALNNGSFDKLGGPGSEVEADETYIGGKFRNMHRSKRPKGTGTGFAAKTAVMGLLERNSQRGKSRVRATIVPNTITRTVDTEVRKNVQLGSHVYTDQLGSYQKLAHGYVHQFVNHLEGYVSGRVHTNGLENFWALFKRCIKGTHVSIEPFHLMRYLDSECFRFNNRTDNDGQRFVKALRGTGGKRLTYGQLTGKCGPGANIDGRGGASGSAAPN